MPKQGNGMEKDDGTVMEFVSVIARALYWAVGCELDALDAASPLVPNDVQTGSSENGHALAVVVLSILALESAISRLRDFKRREGRVHPVDYFAEVAGRRSLCTQVDEVFALRERYWQ